MLVVVGGGGVPDVVLEGALELAGGPAAPIVIFPQASELAGHRGRRGRDVEEGRRHERAVAAAHRRRRRRGRRSSRRPSSGFPAATSAGAVDSVCSRLFNLSNE
ncbi:MAG: hypothetical protein MZV64_43500, partial [Ignavibacteriales bacterium]|nr:hypothetical protein [Ignavibacteriales bacterium]